MSLIDTLPKSAEAMLLTKGQKRIIERVLNVFETGSAAGDYSNISIFNDGPHGIRQITYGRSQTTEYGNLRELVRRYCSAPDAKYREELAPFAPLVGRQSLTNNAAFKNYLRRAAKEDPIMRDVQDQFFDDVYFQPALMWANRNGFTLPLSMLVIYDSFIHSGSILSFLRSRFAEVPPATGGQEKLWVREYVEARHNWLATHPRPILRSTGYRTRTFMAEMAKGNWKLAEPIVAHGVKVDDKDLA